MFSRWSNQKIQFYSLFFVLGGILLTLMLFSLQVSLRCIDENGCIMEHCVLDKFNDKYTDVIDVNAETHSDCRYKLGSTQDLLLQRRTTAQEVVVVTCQPTVNTVIKQSIEIDS